MAKVNPKFIGSSQYRPPLCLELGGKNFHIFMDDGDELSFNFLDGDTVQIANYGDLYRAESYECLKADEDVYFVRIEPRAKKGKVNQVWVFDLAKWLVTRVETEEDLFPEVKRLVKVTPTFGAIKRADHDLPTERHTFSDVQVGKHITWRYNPSMSVPHIYHGKTMYRLPLITEENIRARFKGSTDPGDMKRMEDRLAMHFRLVENYPFTEEPCFHIQINDKMNLFAFCEENEAKADKNNNIGGGGLILLQDSERLLEVGMSFCLGEYYLTFATGEEIEGGDPVDDMVAPYDETALECMPIIYEIEN